LNLIKAIARDFKDTQV